MNKKMIIGFTLSTVLLVLFEYVLLQEIYSQQRMGMLVTGAMGTLGAGAFFIFFFIRYRRTLDRF